MPLLEVKDLAVRYDKAAILNGLSLRVEEGELVGVVGPNGAGKSTLLRAISGLVRFEERMKRGADGDIVLEGEVRLAGERIEGLPAHEIRKRGLVNDQFSFRRRAALPPMTLARCSAVIPIRSIIFNPSIFSGIIGGESVPNRKWSAPTVLRHISAASGAYEAESKYIILR